RRAAYFAGKSCVKCGSTENLELDHIDPSQKVSHRIWSWTESKRLEEIAKCQVLCNECHLVKSIKEKLVDYTHGTHTQGYARGCRCDDCREAHRIYNNNNRKK